MGSVVVGVDVGQKQDKTAIVVCEQEQRVVEPARPIPRSPHALDERDIPRYFPGRTEQAYTARDIIAVPLGTAYPEVARIVARVVEALVRRGILRPRLIVDATGVGLPVVELIAAELGPRARDVTAATFTHGTRYEQDDKQRTAKVGKAYLVSRLQALLQTDRLDLPRTPEARELAEELRTYEIKVSEDAEDKYGAFKVGTHDDLVTALGLAVCYQVPRGGTLYTGDLGRLTRATFGG